jgi:hypothetical protein
MSESQFRELLNQFSVAIRDCRTVYLNAAKDVIENHPELLDRQPSLFMETMDELHRGLLLKMYTSICGFDHLYTRQEEYLGEVLFHHLWNQHVSASQVRESIHGLSRQTAGLNWTSLIRPFRTIQPLQKYVSELETSVMRIGNLMAKADGNANMLEIEELRAIQREILTYLYVKPEGKKKSAEISRDGAQAVQSIYQEASIASNRPSALASANSSCQSSEGSASDEVIELTEAHYAVSSKQPESERQSDYGLESKLSLDEALAELTSLIGLASIKQEVKTLTNFLKLQRLRAEKGLPETKVSLHMAFAGNPGTGKTTVARIIGKIYRAMGILEKGHVIETDRSGLVAEFAGQTAPKTNAIIDRALGGILFVDEAYSLVSEATGGDAFGQEAIQVLLKRMEDDRNRLVVILAGYPDEMDTLLKSNPGLTSRMGRQLTFEDYAASELGQIFGLMSELNHYQTLAEVQAKIMTGLVWLHQHKDKHFGNGRTVRNLFEDSIRQLANRVVDVSEISAELLVRFEPADIQFPGAPPSLFDATRLKQQRYQISCEQCHSSAKVKLEMLSRRVKCKHCDNRFVAQWGEPILKSDA